MATISSEIRVHDQRLCAPFTMSGVACFVLAADKAERQCEHAWQGTVSSQRKSRRRRCHTGSTAVICGARRAVPSSAKIAEERLCRTCTQLRQCWWFRARCAVTITRSGGGCACGLVALEHCLPCRVVCVAQSGGNVVVAVTLKQVCTEPRDNLDIVLERGASMRQLHLSRRGAHSQLEQCPPVSILVNCWLQ